MEPKSLYYVGFSKKGNHFSYKATLTATEYVAVTQLLKDKADAFEVVRDQFYYGAANAYGLTQDINDLLS